MQNEYSILSEAFKITVQGLTLFARNQLHINSGSSDYGLNTIVSVAGDTYTTSTRMPAFTFIVIIILLRIRHLTLKQKNHGPPLHLRQHIQNIYKVEMC